MKKRLLAMFLALVMCLALMPSVALAAEPASGTCGENLTWKLENGVLTVSGTGRMTEYGTYKNENAPWTSQRDTIISAIIGDGVTTIGRKAFSGCTGLTSVTIPDSVTNIGYFAFEDTPWLKNLGDVAIVNGILLKYQGNDSMVTIPDGVTSIGANAFGDCTGLTSVTIPNGVTKIGEYAFDDCTGLTSVTIPSSVTEIGDYAFARCTSLTSIIIPKSVTSIGREQYALKDTFIGCKSLTAIQVDAANPVYTDVDGVLFTKDMKTLLAYPVGRQGAYSIPNGVTSIGPSAFSYCTNLTSIIIPTSVTEIEKSAFSNCYDLTSITIPNGVTKIGEYAFGNCYALDSVAIPDSVTFIEIDAFYMVRPEDVYYDGSETQWNAIKGGFGYYLLGATIHYNSTMPEQPAKLVSAPAQPTNDKLSVDGKDATPAAYKIGGANYFMLRDVAMLLNGTNAQFEISYDNDKKAINITTGKAYTPQGYELKTTPQPNATAETSSDAVYINGEKAELTAYKIGGANFYGIRDLGRALGFNVGWSQDRGMFIESGKPYSDAD